MGEDDQFRDQNEKVRKQMEVFEAVRTVLAVRNYKETSVPPQLFVASSRRDGYPKGMILSCSGK